MACIKGFVDDVAAKLDRLAIIVFVIGFLVSAGRYFGLDAYLCRRFPRLSWL